MPAEPTGGNAAADRTDLDGVKAKERQSVDRRRKEALLPADGGLCGLALSGGGIRSAAMSLGFVEALRRRKLLQFVDYMSTVSGGGYAGAYLSSSAIASGPDQDHGGPTEASGANADGEDEPLKPRILQFVRGGKFLRRTSFFFNRYVIGLFFVWVLVISGLFAVASATAYAFRSLDYPVVNTALTCLKFTGDARRAFFPSFLLAVAWSIAWALSYFKFGPKATGTVARWLFYLLICATLTAIAALIGNGQTSLSESRDGSPPPEISGAMARTAYAALFSALAASLIPYLRPKRLLKSGMAPKNYVERYAFWIATRAVVFGIPFAAIAYFTQENISGWNARRDHRLSRIEITDWSHDNPMWRELYADADRLRLPAKFGHIWPANAPMFPQLTTLKEQKPQVRVVKDVAVDSLAQLAAGSRRLAILGLECDETSWLWEEETEAARQLAEVKAADPGPDGVPLYEWTEKHQPSYAHVAIARNLQEIEASFLEKWGRLAGYLLERAAFNETAVGQNQFYR